MRSDPVPVLVLVLVLVPVSVPACGTFVESDDRVARATLGDAGGALHLEAFSVVVPPHALAATVTLSARRAAFDAPNGAAFILDPPEALFDAAAPATVTITYDAATYPHPAEVFVATYTGADWHALPAAGVPEPGAAHASTTHTGTFGLIHCPGGTCPTSNVDASAGH